ncbi:hypothetical protein GCM10010171_31180 [Actinokineospora fastidiosa]|uniref:Uncharacterized protein n=2 Tax=Pseudonocardiaceae TaxID=2070 RepID=A0A918GIA9_9PSEU|nr:short chain dehydrogenase [Actinokineospora sp. UTMC 2448]GGS34501.1 hypothetical protein GCM10010171_31180 [Actinokineospora fastidiosa]
MLAGVSTTLVAAGWHIVLPSRRYAPLAVDGTGRARWVRADWTRPNDLACQAARVLGGQADLLVAWVADTVRIPVLRAVGPLLKPHAPVVEVHADRPMDPVLDTHRTHQVVLGEVGYAGRTRWLTDEEITTGVLEAIDRALAGQPPMARRLAERV